MSGYNPRARTRIATTDFSGLRLLGTRQGVAIDHWQALDDFIRRELDEEAATLLAEPEALGGGKYDWYAKADGTPESLGTLTKAKRRNLLARTEDRLAALRSLAANARTDQRFPERRGFGEMLHAALTVPEERLDQLLFQVGDVPVLINWGARIDSPGKEAGPLVIKLPPLVKEASRRRISLAVPLWCLFLIISTAIFTKLVEGCVLFQQFGIGPSFCTIEEPPLPQHIAASRSETARLEAQLTRLVDRVADSPQCLTDVPAYVGSDKFKTMARWVPPPPPPPIVAKGKIDDAALHQKLNDGIRAAGGGICAGVEILAVWDMPANVDLRVYCLPEAANQTVQPEQIADAYNPNACGAQWDFGSEGNEPERPFIERICISGSDGAGARSYYATVYREDSDPSNVPVTIYARGGGSTESVIIDAKPNAESEDGLPLTIQ